MILDAYLLRSCVNKLIKIYWKIFRRFIAFWIDWGIILLPNILISVLVDSSKNTAFKANDYFDLRLGLTYFFYFTYSTYRSGQTIGKKITKTIVLADDADTPPGLKYSIYRHLPLALIFVLNYFAERQSGSGEKFKNASHAILGLWLFFELLVYFLTRERQFLHDYLAKTRVENQLSKQSI